MKKLLFGIIAIACLSATFSSCTIEKRVHQNGYHISWKRHHSAPSEMNIASENTPIKEVTALPFQDITKPNNHSVETISASTNNEIILTKENKYYQNTQLDTITPDPKNNQEEYFNNTYIQPSNTLYDKDIQIANWALGTGIGAISTPLWTTILFLSIGTASGFSWSLLGVFILLGSALFIALEILAITLAIRFLRLHGKDPEYRKYRSRSITGLILAGIYPALIAINIILAIVLAI